jgi:DNA-binding MarR family transcriptional regulator
MSDAAPHFIPIGSSFRGAEGRVGYLLRQASLAFRAAMNAELRALGLTAPQYSLLYVIHQCPRASGVALARMSMLTQQTTNELLLTLHERGLIDRTRGADRRVLEATCTPAGTAAVAAARERVHAIEDQLLDPLPEAERRRLREWLVEVASVLAGQDDDLA